jgi:multisubunit Na+/H+ antiporter MnhB subunit
MTTVIFTLLATFVVGPFLFIEQGWAISTLWNWFVAPLGAPQIGIATAIGISLTAAVIRMKGSEKSPERTRRESIERLVGIFLVPLVGVGLGWIVKQFV